MSILIKDTTREERERIVAESFMEIRQVAVRITGKKFEIKEKNGAYQRNIRMC